MNPLYQQLLGVIAVIIILGALGILLAWKERRARNQSGRS
jgi:Flp pilus assembly protein TadB